MTVYVKILKNQHKTPKTNSDYSKIAGYKANIQQLISFLIPVMNK